MRGKSCSLVSLLLLTLLSTIAIADGINSNSTTHSTSKSLGSSISNPDLIYDGTNSTNLRLSIDSSFGTCSYAYAVVTYQLNLNSSSAQNLSMTQYSETSYDFSTGWSNLTDFKMWVNVTDQNGNRQLWNSSTPDNQASPSKSTTNLGLIRPFANSTVELSIGMEENISFSSECSAHLDVYEIWSMDTSPQISYSPQNFYYYKANQITPVLPINLGGSSTTWSINRSLPSGLFFNTSSGTISGIPTSSSELNTYLIEASNSGGSNQTIISIEVIGAPELNNPITCDFSYLYNGTIVNSFGPINNGGKETSWSITPDLEFGLVFSNISGQISGTLSSIGGPSKYSINASNPAGFSTCDWDIMVVEGRPIITYSTSDIVFIINSEIAVILPNISGLDATSWSIYPDIPQGLTFSNGTLSGTPTELSSETIYLVNATNNAGTDPFELRMKVIDVAPKLTIEESNFTFYNGTGIPILLPINNGGTIVSWAMSPPLPAGLTFNNSTGEISGTPTGNAMLSIYVIEATNTGGTDYINLSINIIGRPLISYQESNYSFTINRSEVMLIPINSGDMADYWIIEPNLPSGLIFSASNGSIIGTPIEFSSIQTFNITATNDAGNDTFTLMIIIDQAPQIQLGKTTLHYIISQKITNITIELSYDEEVTWSVSPALPEGLNLNSLTGVISGTPTILGDLIEYTIKAEIDSKVIASTIITIEIVEQTIQENDQNNPPSTKMITYFGLFSLFIIIPAAVIIKKKRISTGSSKSEKEEINADLKMLQEKLEQHKIKFEVFENKIGQHPTLAKVQNRVREVLVASTPSQIFNAIRVCVEALMKRACDLNGTTPTSKKQKPTLATYVERYGKKNKISSEINTALEDIRSYGNDNLHDDIIASKAIVALDQFYAFTEWYLGQPFFVLVEENQD